MEFATIFGQKTIKKVSRTKIFYDADQWVVSRASLRKIYIVWFTIFYSVLWKQVNLNMKIFLAFVALANSAAVKDAAPVKE